LMSISRVAFLRQQLIKSRRFKRHSRRGRDCRGFLS
jgi:hypothetical protein